jgi:hypothetical protein
MRPDTPSLSIIGTPLKVFFLFFNFEGDQRCKNCQGPRVLSFDCLMPVSQSVVKKREKESEESRNEEWHPLSKGG